MIISFFETLEPAKQNCPKLQISACAGAAPNACLQKLDVGIDYYFSNLHFGTCTQFLEKDYIIQTMWIPQGEWHKQASKKQTIKKHCILQTKPSKNPML